MWQELPWASGKLSQEEYETRRNLCTDRSVRSLAADPVFLDWLDSKRQDLQRRKQQARWSKRSWLIVFLTTALLAVSGAFICHRHGLASLHLPSFKHLSRSSFPNAGSLQPAGYLRSVSDLAQPLLDHAKPGPYLAAANSRLLPVYQQVASSLSAGIIQLPSLVPHSAQHEATPSQPPQGEPMPSSTPSGAAASSSSSLEAARASQSEGSAGNGPVPAEAMLLQRMGNLLPVKSIARIPGRAAKSLQSISKQVLLALPSRTSSVKTMSKVPASVIAQPSAPGNPSPDGHEDAMSTSPHHDHAVADDSSPGLLQRVNRSSTSLAVYIARMPMRTAKTWGHITKQTILALPAANYLSPYKPSTQVISADVSQAESTLERVPGTSTSATELAIEQGDTAESAAETTLLGRFNRSSKPLANLIARLPARTSQGLKALSRQTLLALPAAKPATNGSAQDEAGAALPAIIDATASETQEAAVISEHQVRNDTAGPTAGSAVLGQLDAKACFKPAAADDFSAANSADKATVVKAARSGKVWWTILAVLLFMLAIGAAADVLLPTMSPAASAACPQVQAQAQKRTQQAAIACTSKPSQSAPRKRSRTDPSPKRAANTADHMGKPHLEPKHAAASGQLEAKATYTTTSNTSSMGQVMAVLRQPGSSCSPPRFIAASRPATASLRPVPCTNDAATQQPSSPVQDPAQVLGVPTFLAPAWIHVGDSSHAAIEPPHDAHVLSSTGESLGALLTEEALSLAPPDLDSSSGASSSSSSVASIEDAASAQIVAQAADGVAQLQHDAASDESEEDLEEASQSTAVPLSESESSSDDDAGSHTSEVDGFVVVEA